MSKEPKSKPPLWANIVAGAIIFGIIGSCAALMSKPDGDRRFGSSDALGMCQGALKSVARDPDMADIPYVENMGRGSEYYFSWGAQTKMARMRNGLGLDVAVSASCIVNGVTRRITSLSLDGRSIL